MAEFYFLRNDDIPTLEAALDAAAEAAASATLAVNAAVDAAADAASAAQASLDAIAAEASAEAAALAAEDALSQFTADLSTVVRVTAQTFDSSQMSQARTNIGLGTSAVKNTGTSGDTVPLNNTQNDFGERLSLDRISTLVFSNDLNQAISSANLNTVEGLRFRNTSDVGNIVAASFQQGTTDAGRGAIILRKTAGLTAEFLIALRNADSNPTVNAAFRANGDLAIKGKLVPTDAAGTISSLSANLSTLSGYTVSNDETLASNSSTKLTTEFAVKSYVDASVGGTTQEKASVRAATTAALPANTYDNGAKTITADANGALAAQDGVTLLVDETLLVKNEAAELTGHLKHGSYVVTQVGSGAAPFILTRTADCDADAEFPGSQWLIREGTTQGTTKWKVTNTSVTMGTTAVKISQTFAASIYTAGSGLDLTGQQFSVEANLASFNTNTGTAADKAPYSTASNTWSEYTLTSFGRTWGGLADVAAALVTLGLPYAANVIYFPDLATAMAEDLSGVPFIYIGGYDIEGDAPVTRWEKVISEPTHSAKDQDVSLSWWQPDPKQGPIDLRALGAKVDDATIDTIAWNKAISMLNSEVYKEIVVPNGFSYIDAKLTVLTASDCSIRSLGLRTDIKMHASAGAEGRILQVGDGVVEPDSNFFTFEGFHLDLSDVADKNIPSNHAALELFAAGQVFINRFSTSNAAIALKLGDITAGTDCGSVRMDGFRIFCRTSHDGVGIDINGANAGIVTRGTVGTTGKLTILTCRAATTAALPANTYANGASGVGATLTGDVNGALPAQDGVSLIVGDKLLVKNEAAEATGHLKHGAYTVTNLGSASTQFVLTRDPDSDVAAEIPGSRWTIQEGTTQANDIWRVLNTSVTVGTTAIKISETTTANGWKGMYIHPGVNNTADTMFFGDVRLNPGGNGTKYTLEIDASNATGLGNLSFSQCILDTADVANIFIHIDSLGTPSTGIQVSFSECISNDPGGGVEDSLAVLDNTGNSPYFNVTFANHKFSTSRARAIRFTGGNPIYGLVSGCTFQDRSQLAQFDKEFILIENGLSGLNISGNSVKKRDGSGTEKDYLVKFTGDASNILIAGNECSLLNLAVVTGTENIAVGNRHTIKFKDNTGPGNEWLMDVQTLDDDPVVIHRIPLEDETSYVIRAKVHAYQANGGQRAYYEQVGLFYRDAGGFAVQQGHQSDVSFESDSVWACLLSAQAGSNNVIVTVTGDPSAPVNWFSELEISPSVK